MTEQQKDTIAEALRSAEQRLIGFALMEEWEYGSCRSESVLEALGKWPEEVYACRSALMLLKL